MKDPQSEAKKQSTSCQNLTADALQTYCLSDFSSVTSVDEVSVSEADLELMPLSALVLPPAAAAAAAAAMSLALISGVSTATTLLNCAKSTLYLPLSFW